MGKPATSSEFMSEFVGTFFLVYTIGMNVLQNVALAPISIGGILMVMVFATGNSSGAHFNPAVTLGVLTSGTSKGVNDKARQLISPKDAGIYMVVQCAAAFLGAMMYYWVLGATFTFQPGVGFTVYDAIIAELLFTTALVFVILNCATTIQDADNHYFGLAIGFTLMSSAFAIGGVSGCCLNPAVAVGVMLSNYIHTGGGGKYFLLYTIVPFIGGLLGSVLFRVVRAYEYSRPKGLPTTN